MPSISKPCHNCRRRRLRCDRSWPACHKCAVSGQECLGYGRVFVWTQAIEAHGHLKPSPAAPASAAAATCASSSSSAPSASALAPSSRLPWTLAAGSQSRKHQLQQQQQQQSSSLPQGRRQKKSSRSQVIANGPCSGVEAVGSGVEAGDDVADQVACSGQGGEGPEATGYRSHTPGQERLGRTCLAQAEDNNIASGFNDDLGTPSRQSIGEHGPRPQDTPISSTTPKGTSSTQQGRHGSRGPGRVSLGNLTDPVFQDLDRNSRYYLAHFADRVCKDLVARDGPDSNPFRELIPLTNRHPLLLHILIATSAIHWSNIFRPITAIPTGLTDPGGYLAQLRTKDLVSRQALIDALTAKQKAMGHLREVLDTLDPAVSEVALAAMHFFVKFDLIDLERHDDRGWQTHLEGASSILALLAPNGAGSSSSRMLRDCVIADCFIYHILGSTLASGALAARIARYAFELLPVMKRVEVNSYLSCPAEILQVILVASQLSYETPCTDWSLSAADEALALIGQALAFDIPGWASGLQQQSSKVTDIESRVHVASAHRSAACLYILQALPLARAVRPVDADFLVSDILGHLAQIDESDPYFKATSWPTFIAGAETRDPEKRTWTLKRLLAIWQICSWGYIFTAIEMLKATWAMRDRSESAGAVIEPGVNWLQGLKDMGFDYLIV
ncbi:hypothetical protein HIM_00707 [Hirsutella minnesotensis 3608]|nr:hypothetical protein HIM_00707 [Hirsutella minnesotensis 3608]